MVTIYDIAERCGTSAATVSYVLNGRGRERRISKSTQERVLQAAEELGYQRVKQPQSARPVIAIYWIQKRLETTMPALISGINTAMSAELCPVDVIIRSYEQGHIDNQTALWEQNPYDAVMIVGADSHDLQWLEQNALSVPTVLVNRDLPGYSCVTIDHEEAGRLAGQHAILKGNGSISLILNPSSLYGLNQRGESIIRTCADNGVDISGNLFYCENNIDDGYELGWDMIRKGKLSKVIVCIYDIVGLGVIRALNEAGIPIGDDVQVIACNSGLPRLFARTTPPMTVVDLKTEEIAERALKYAIGLATHQITGPQKMVLHPTIIYRQSCPI